MAAGFKKATVNAAGVVAAETNYPAYVDLSRLGITTLAEAQSVRVYEDSEKTTEWAREIVSSNEMHVKIPNLTTTTEIFVEWDGVSSDYASADTYGRNAVWSDYWGVWHMNGANGSATKKADATGNNRNITEFNGPLTPETNQWGDTDGSYSLEGVIGATSSTTQYDYLSIGRPDSAFGTNTPFTFSTWFNLQVSDTATADYIIRQERNDPSGRNSWAMEILNGANQNKLRFQYSPTTGITSQSATSTTPLSLDTWHYVVGRRRATDFFPVVTLDGTENTVGTSGNGSAFQTNNDDAYVNRRFNSVYSGSQRYAQGYWSEMRIRITDVGDDWIETEYNNQSNEAVFWGAWTNVGPNPAPTKPAFITFAGL